MPIKTDSKLGIILIQGFNAVASAGLAICISFVPFFNKESAFLAVFCLCGAMIFAGLHTPGVITAMVQIAPAFSGIITGWSFFAVAWFSIGNKILTKYIVQSGSVTEWGMVFRVSALVAALPVIVFTIWGSADREVNYIFHANYKLFSNDLVVGCTVFKMFCCIFSSPIN